jgi:hypothetical protein
LTKRKKYVKKNREGKSKELTNQNKEQTELEKQAL